jgi:hypothetical protein
MIDNDLRQLDERALDHSLDHLEADIWRGVAAYARQREAARRVASFQGVVIVLALLGSAAVGVNMARPGSPAGDPVVLASGAELMPSHLLLGERP